MGFALQSLLLCGFWRIPSMYGLKVTVLELVMVSIIAVKFIGASLGTEIPLFLIFNDVG